MVGNESNLTLNLTPIQRLISPTAILRAIGGKATREGEKVDRERGRDILQIQTLIQILVPIPSIPETRGSRGIATIKGLDGIPPTLDPGHRLKGEGIAVDRLEETSLRGDHLDDAQGLCLCPSDLSMSVYKQRLYVWQVPHAMCFMYHTTANDIGNPE